MKEIIIFEFFKGDCIDIRNMVAETLKIFK